MEKIHIDHSTNQVSEHFQKWEYFVDTKPANLEWDMPIPLALGGEILRIWIGFQLNSTSSYRPGDDMGFHKEGLADDYCTPYWIHGQPAPKTPEQVLAEFKQECLNYINGQGSQLITDLRKAGITGFGVEGVCIHIDCRTSVFARKDEYGEYMVFEWSGHWEDGKLITDIDKSL